VTVRKIFISDYASLSESKLLPDTEKTYNTVDADIFINPTYGAIYNKTIIINLPIEIPIEQLKKFNQIVSRFPIGYGIPVIPYQFPSKQKLVKKPNFSCLILNPSMMSNIKYARLVRSNDFLIGVSETVDGGASLIGLEVYSNKIDD
jgi:hypothetical protein